MSLIPLRIPMGYAVCYNKFSDVEPVPCKDSDGLIDNWGYFTEDILQIVKMQIKDGEWVIPKENKVILDLGWYPDSSLYGHYKLVLVNEHWEVIREKYSNNRFEIRDTLEDWMNNPFV
ncbi:hypothetical protein [Aneurinibacillus uraniidurans]|uniref:hypothetical protein n=1 Tax=Aneurinibacillus uraniidurans TaxID=2966586 RepID=UPI00234A6162|nr:hypothetical protein [Aneurinibacillus sp. B1]WCN37015.1 hypothetical protein PO771_14290 [Aneurinibacillus sp. B1]